MKKKIPILEYDASKDVIIDPQKLIKPIDISEYCIVCFFQEVLKKLYRQKKSKIIHVCKSEIGKHPIYEMRFKRKRVAFFHPGVGAPLAAGLLEEVIALGCKKFIACGGAGVLDKNIEVGHIIIPTSAIRDEGTSYHYLPPTREVNASKKGIKAIEKVLKKYDIKYKKSKTWTNDGFYRETIDKIKLRKSEGCLTVEMEAAAFFAVAKHRNVEFAQLLYSGDDVSGKEWDSRSWDRKTIREKLFYLAVEACINM
jgi:uridine phosphorylase